jgi:hypothetical protein
VAAKTYAESFEFLTEIIDPQNDDVLQNFYGLFPNLEGLAKSWAPMGEAVYGLLKEKKVLFTRSSKMMGWVHFLIIRLSTFSPLSCSTLLLASLVSNPPTSSSLLPDFYFSFLDLQIPLALLLSCPTQTL